MKNLTNGLATITLILASSHSFAAGINERQANQQGRITQGFLSGELTRSETHSLTLEQRKLALKEAHFRSDGVLTKRERARLQYSLSKSSSTIYKKKHNNRDRG